MKKNLFLLFSIYFFVLQPLIIGILRGQANFFWLGAINLVAIILIGMLSSSVEAEKEKTHDHEKKPEVVKEAKVSFHDHFRAVAKERNKKSELVLPTIISLLVAILIFFMFQSNNAALQVIILFAVVIGFIVFLGLTLIFKHRITKRFWTLVGTKIYLILLIASLALTAYDYYQVHKDFNATFQDYVAQNLLGEERIPTDGYVFTGEGTVLGTGLGSTTGVQEVSSDIFTGTTVNSDIQEATGTVLGTSSEVITPTTNTAATTLGNQKLMDAVLYLLKKYDIPLITKKDISFTYVTFKNPYYNEWRTAYASKLIGKSTNPSKYIVCESYIVMKGILEKWNVPYTSTTVLAKFRAEAVKRNALNGCVKGKIVTDTTL
ncbi:MAG: hypothetical protein NT085_00515 [candidate division SR1 bacterium]|nr:hypothetical protein [candidate division SR1 bacterium]